MPYKPLVVRSKPGIQRDGTRFDSDAYLDGLWTRFDRDRPRKMPGYNAVTDDLPEKIYGMGVFSLNNTQYLHLGSAAQLNQVKVSGGGAFSGLADRTPAALVVDAMNNWQMDTLPNAVATTSSIIAHAAPNLDDISDSTETPVFYNADITAGSILIDTATDPVSGGVCVVGPYMFSYGNAGFINQSDPNDPTTIANTSRVTGSKIVKGMSIRGGGGGPSALFWSLDALIRASFTSGTPEFAFDTLAETSIMSSRAVVDYDGIQYWWGIDRPMMFNGVVQEIPNDYNIDWFLDNFDFSRRQEVFAFKVPRFGEIWWCFPMGETYQAVIYNVRQRIWYDTLLPGKGRTSGIYSAAYGKPFLTDPTETDSGFTLWQHETGTDAVNGSDVQPVEASFTTSDFSLLNGDDANSKGLSLSRLEPDFVQAGDMSVQAIGNANSRSPDAADAAKTFPADDGTLTASEQLVDFKVSRRQLRLKFTSNTTGGYFYMGKCVMHVDAADARVTQ